MKINNFFIFASFTQRFTFKVVLASTAVYWTNQWEVWSQLTSKEPAYQQLITCSKALISQNTPNSLKFQVNSIE